MKSECRAPRKDKEGWTANAAMKDITDALLLSVRSSLDDWIMDSGASFHSCSSRDIMEPFTAGAVSQPHLWHSCLGHMSEKGMKVLKSRGLLPELKSVDVGLCEHCVLGKKKRVSFMTTGRASKTEKLELVYTDLWGPAPVTSLGGSMYYMTFIDDCTRKEYPSDDKTRHEYVDLDILNTRIMRPANSVGAQMDEIERTEEETEPESEEPIAESSTPLALGREPRMRRAPDRWVYRIKEESDGTKRYKARLVVKGFQQRYDIDFTDVFTPVVKLTTIRLVLRMVAAENLELQQLDVKTTFLHGDLEEEIYMVQSERYRENDQQDTPGVMLIIVAM
ncbi:cysteine-rich RLK (RECEPTOR-like protein kinase) 8 [Striga hermonthica]|uniref:Cysteine-rich RLK (RECEPTOR-like protein kinase) 8 n=1 Tax=Striga hermonthica TaxID=68872 RepID=A0A9N7R6Q0_STRHE|nr:cysteine-rich RLK (RECEPTOR-like protein kinase) 8 [Striga hermonthica]